MVFSDVFHVSVQQVYINDTRIYPAYSNSVLRITGTDMVITLEIKEIQAIVVFRDSSFSIDLPYKLFSGNTEGQCGERAFPLSSP